MLLTILGQIIVITIAIETSVHLGIFLSFLAILLRITQCIVIMYSVRNNALLFVRDKQIMPRTRSNDHSVVTTDNNHFLFEDIFRIVLQHVLLITRMFCFPASAVKVN